jgi:hypothetical protein
MVGTGMGICMMFTLVVYVCSSRSYDSDLSVRRLLAYLRASDASAKESW